MPTWLKQIRGPYVIEVMPYVRNGPRGTWAYAGAVSKPGKCGYKFGSGPSRVFSDQLTAATEGFLAGEDLIKSGAADVDLE